MRRIALGLCHRLTGASAFRVGAIARFSTTPLLHHQTHRLLGRSVTGDAADAQGDEHTGGSLSAPFHGSVTRTPEAASVEAARPGRIEEKEDITVTGPKGEAVSITPVGTFADIKNLPEWLAEGVKGLGFTIPSVIQKFTIPALQEGHDIIGLAPTGSGKTVAFAIPALQHLQPSKSGSPSVLVLAPTRELVQQTTKVFEKLARGRVRVAEAYGGSPREIQARRLHRGCEVLVACPGRLKDFLDSGDVSLANLSFLVFDEADRLLDMGFQIQIDDILGFVEPSQQVQRMMWSATWPTAVQELARAYLSQDRLLIRAGTAGTGAQVNEHIKQRIIFADAFRDRIEKLVGLIESGEIDDNTAKLIIFVERQTDTEEVANSLSQRLGIDSRYVGVIHGGLSQRRRDAVMGDFKSSNIRILVATDVASRGLDIPDVTCVINFQAPQNIDSYCHRIGRTGRAGRKGDAFTFIGRQDGGIAAELVEYLQRCKMNVPSELLELEKRHAEESRYRRRPQRGGYDRFSNDRNQGGSRGGFGGGRRSGRYDRNQRQSYGSQSRRYPTQSSYEDSRNQRQNYGSDRRSYGSPDRAYDRRQAPSFDDDSNGWM